MKTKLLGRDVEDGRICEVRGYWDKGVCYVKDIINKELDEVSIGKIEKLDEKLYEYQESYNDAKDDGTMLKDIYHRQNKICGTINKIIDFLSLPKKDNQ